MSLRAIKLTREEYRVLADYWLATHECLSDEEYEESGELVMKRVDDFESILADTYDGNDAVEQLKNL